MSMFDRRKDTETPEPAPSAQAPAPAPRPRMPEAVSSARDIAVLAVPAFEAGTAVRAEEAAPLSTVRLSRDAAWDGVGTNGLGRTSWFATMVGLEAPAGSRAACPSSTWACSSTASPWR